MGDKSAIHFSEDEIEQLRRSARVQDVGILTPAAFKVAASLGNGQLNFYTLLFLEAAPDKFMDKRPEAWQWQEGQNTLPIILSRDFLNMYNYIFAPSQGLPQLSENSIKALGFNLIINEGTAQRNFRAQVEGFSDRISSVLVPQSFIDYGNAHFSGGIRVLPSRLILKVDDPSDKAFVSMLESKGYTTNSEQLRWNKMRSVVEIVSGATGILALLLMGVGILVFVLFVELTMSKARDSVRLLIQLGYSPHRLGKFLSSKFIPIALSTVFISLMLGIAIQYAAFLLGHKLQLTIPAFPGWPVWSAAGAVFLILGWQIRRSISASIHKNI